MKKICFIATIPAVINSFLREHINASAQRWSVTVVCNPSGVTILDGMAGRLILMNIERKASLWKDFLFFIQLLLFYRREKFEIVHSIMPKTGFLAMFSAWINRVPNRIHTFTGQVWATRKGLTRSILKVFDKLIVYFATEILVDSPSQLDFLISEGILMPGKGKVIGNGSICGIDPDKFKPDQTIKSCVRHDLNIDIEATVLLFLGRLNKDKGVLDLAHAFSEISKNRPGTILLLVGAEEDVSFEDLQKICGEQSDKLRRVDFTPHPEQYIAASDIFCLPSYREGFGQSIIEAAATEIPAAASRIYGITDAVEDGVTGLLFPPGDIKMLIKALLTLIEDNSLREKMGTAARARALRLFSSQKITTELINLYQRLMENTNSLVTKNR